MASDYSLPVARALMERLADHQRMRWRSVRDSDGRLLVLNASIIDEDRLWGWLLAGEPGARADPHIAAYWDAISWALGQGLGCDFGSAATEGIRNFKTRLGCALEHCAVAERVRPRFYRPPGPPRTAGRQACQAR